MVADGKPVLALLRGDHQLSETKFASAVGAIEVRPAHPHEIRQWFGADAGSLGPVGVTTMPILVDSALQGRKNMIAGANEDDYHLRNVTPGKDFQAKVVDLRQVMEGDACANCGEILTVTKTIELGHIFKLGYKYSESMGLRVLNAEGAEVTPIMGSYGIGIERILSSAIEQHHDQDGIILPASIAPFEVVITPVNNSNAEQMTAAHELYRDLLHRKVDVLLDDRDERPGVKFKDADLIGVPYRVTVGKKIGQGVVELSERRSKQSTDLPLSGVADELASRLRQSPAQR
jgi:prolyl-tRNA synthetase